LCALANEITFKFSQRAKDMENQPAAATGVPRRYFRTIFRATPTSLAMAYIE
jgi:hypothetical protein